MEGPRVCEKCGLKAVRYELERQGIILRFCDFCYWGEVDAEAGGGKAGDLSEEPSARAVQGG